MTRDEIMAMDADQLRLAVAEALGIPVSWYECRADTYETKWELRPFNSVTREPLPDWPNSIAAAWELEETIPEEPKNARFDYAWILVEVVGRKGFPYSTTWALVHATPEQRSRAWRIWKLLQMEGDTK